ncbi:MAG TPA: hypothetical protein VKN18_17920, partial [Blastocatellia bacterium]|nr:hypothetical protein [Blastocatellia bacterium]
ATAENTRLKIASKQNLLTMLLSPADDFLLYSGFNTFQITNSNWGLGIGGWEKRLGFGVGVGA